MEAGSGRSHIYTIHVDMVSNTGGNNGGSTQVLRAMEMEE